jgi:uncharacterized protein YcfL
LRRGKHMKKVVLSIAILILASCGGSTNTSSSSDMASVSSVNSSQTNSSSELPSSSVVSSSLDPIQSLTKEESDIYKTFLAFVTPDYVGFINAPQARLLDVGEFKVHNTNFYRSLLKIQGTNSAGGTISKNYQIFVRLNFELYYYEEKTSFVVATGYVKPNIGNINRAIAHYWSELGL